MVDSYGKSKILIYNILKKKGDVKNEMLIKNYEGYITYKVIIKKIT